MSWRPPADWMFLGVVPVTGQTLFLGVWSMIGRPKIVVSSILIYFLLGSLGWPVWASHSADADKLISPTAGYLWGFLIMAGFLSTTDQYRGNWKQILLSQFIFNGGVLLFGYTILRFHLEDAWSRGVVPYLPGAMLKALLASGLIYLYYRFRQARL